MSTYTHDTDTDTGKLRALVSDTDVSGLDETALLSDEELTVFKNLAGGNLLLGAAIALRAMGAGVPAVSFEAGDVTINKREISRERRMLADSYQKLAYSIPAEYVDSVVYEISRFGIDKSEYVNDPSTS